MATGPGQRKFNSNGQRKSQTPLWEMTGTCFNQTNFRHKCKFIKGQFTALEKSNKYMKEKSILLPLMGLFSILKGKGEGRRRGTIYATAF